MFLEDPGGPEEIRENVNEVQKVSDIDHPTALKLKYPKKCLEDLTTIFIST